MLNADPKIAKVLQEQHASLWQKQSNFRNLWNTTAQFCMPAWDNFIGEFAEGVNRNTRIFDSTAVTATQRFGAVMQSMLTPSSTKWHKLVCDNEELNDRPEVKRHLDSMTKVLFAARYHPRANFAPETDVAYMSLGAFGNDVLFVDEDPGNSLRYRNWPMSEVCWAVNNTGQVDTLFRKFKYSAKQAVDHWGKAGTPAAIQRAFEKSPYDELEFLHVVRPNPEHVRGSWTWRGHLYECYYIFLGDSTILERGTYRTWPFGIGRYRVAPRENYGRGPAIDCLPDIRTANEMIKTALRAGQKAVDPPILLAEDSIISAFSIRPGALNYGMVTSDGKPLAQPFTTQGNWELGKEQLQETRQVINDNFLVSLFQYLVDNDQAAQMTATVALLRAQEKGELIAPAMSRQQSEFLGNIIVREVDLLRNAGIMPRPPPIMEKMGAGWRVEYTSPLARAMRAEEGSAIMNWVADLGTMAQIDKSVALKADLHEAADIMADVRGVPARVVRSEEQVQTLLEHQAQMQQEATAAQQAPDVADSVLKLAQASQAAGSGGGAQGGGTGAPLPAVGEAA